MKVFVALLIVAVIAVAAWFFLQGQAEAPTDESMMEGTMPAGETVKDDPNMVGGDAAVDTGVVQ